MNGNLLCHFEDPEKPESPEGGQPEASGPFVEIDPEHFEDGAGDDDRVEAIERTENKFPCLVLN